MRFRVHCANPDTGEELNWEIECATIQEAEQRAQDAGMLVSSVEPIADTQLVEVERQPIQATEVRQVGPPTVQVQTQPTRSNSLGIASLILGILAFLICWIPFVAIVSMPLSGLGLLLGIIGLVLALTRAGYGVGFSIAGSSVSVLALLIASVMGFGMFAATSDVISNITEEMEASAIEGEALRTQENSVKTAYITEHLELYDVSAKYTESVIDGRVPGVLFKVRNNGERSLDKVEVTVYFKDASGNVIAEEDYLPVLVTEYSFFGDNKPLKAGYVWQMEQGKFYAAKSVPSEWDEGNIAATITDIRFTETE